MAKNWWHKLMDWFSDEPIESNNKSNTEKAVPRRPGRIEENNRNVHPRVVHHYPQNDKFRPSFQINKRKRVEHIRPERPSTTEKEQETPPTNERKEKFTGINFKAEDIPSPVFGFHKRRNLEPPDIYFKETSHLAESAEEHSSTMELEPEYENDMNLEKETFVEPVEQDVPDQSDSVSHVEKTRDHEKVVEDGGTTSDKNKEATIAHQQSVVKKAVERRKESNDKRTPAVPYNVMMLKRDKVKQRADSHGRTNGNYKFPSLSLLAVPPRDPEDDDSWLHDQQTRLEETLRHFNVKAKVVGVTKGPSVTRFEIQPSPGVKVNKITKLNDDLKLSLAAKDIRIEAPIPGKNLIGIEIPNRVSKAVFIREIIRERAFRQNSSALTAALGLDISGSPVVTDLQQMPHGLIAGATGSGKSVCINSLLVSLLYKASPDEVKLLLIDPKMVELAPFQDIPHLAAPVITDPKEASLALKWTVGEMERRYEAFAKSGVRDIAKYNKKHGKPGEKRPMPYIVVVIDELADLMMVSPQDVEDAICRIAQKARACGIHLILATRRPSVDVITGLIKANVPTRIAFSVSSQADSRTILDTGGAEKLLGKGDMLLIESGASKSVRVQGNFVSDDEIDALTDFVKRQGKPEFLFQKDELVSKGDDSESDDELFTEACYYVLEQGSASSSGLQRRFRIGYNRAARLVDIMESKGIISEASGSKPRSVLISEQEFEDNILSL